MKITTAGRTDLDGLFTIGGIREYAKRTHHPFLVFVPIGEDEIEVQLVESPKKLLLYPAETKVMVQWEGKWRSDFFQFTVGDLQEHIKLHPKKEYYEI
jgi:hypothetical protein